MFHKIYYFLFLTQKSEIKYLQQFHITQDFLRMYLILYNNLFIFCSFILLIHKKITR